MRRTFRVVSGGQTGVDRAALDAAMELGIPAGGWCPRGRRSESGRIPRRYRLRETPSRNYSQRTEWNVRDSDGTLIVTIGRMEGGTLLTARLARDKHARPLLVLQLGQRVDSGRFRAWLRRHSIRSLNVAGPRASRHPLLYRRTKELLLRLLAPLA